jgi:hypothetical protein
MGGCAITRGALLHILRNRTYLGEIVHKGSGHPGRHSAIVDAQTFAAAHALLARNTHVKRTRIPKAAAALLYGRLFDCDGQLMEPIVLRGRARRLYRYYVSRPVGRQDDGDTGDDAIRRVPAAAIEELLERRLASIVRVQPGELDRDLIRDIVVRAEIHASAVHVVLRARALAFRSGQRATIDSVRRMLQPGERVTTEPHDSGLFRVLLPVRLKLRGGRTWVVGPGGAAVASSTGPNRKLIHRVRAAHAILRACDVRPDAPNPQLRYARAPKSAHQMAMLRWAFLAPDLQQHILQGTIAAGEVADLPIGMPIPLLWSQQRALFNNTENKQ